jgi:hypothetical protein
MEFITIKLPSDFNHQAFEDQLMGWTKAGHTPEEILQKAGESFPWVCAEHVNYILGWIKRMQVLNAVAELSMSREITRTIKKRRKHIRELEATMKQKAEIPLSMHNLYRGLLRDHESMCYKLQQRDIKLQSERMKLEERRARDVDKSRQELIKSLYRKPVNEKSPMDYQGDEEDEEQSPPPAPSKNGSGLGMFSLFVGFCLSLFLIPTGSQRKTTGSNTVSTIMLAKPWRCCYHNTHPSESRREQHGTFRNHRLRDDRSLSRCCHQGIA